MPLSLVRALCLLVSIVQLSILPAAASTEIYDRDHLVSIQRSDVPGGEIVTNKTTWIVVHGWNASRTSSNITNLASAIRMSRPNDQVLTLDWSKLADTGYLAPCLAAANIVPVATWAAPVLQAYGFQPSNLNLVGHSFGAYVVDEIAKRMPSKVRSLVALDPAANVCPTAFDPVSSNEVNFARDAIWSWAFHSSSAGNEYVPVRAHEAFIVDSGLISNLAHSAVVDLFAYMIMHQSDQFSLYFGLDDLLDDAYGPWVLDLYSSYFLSDDSVRGYEAIIYDHPNGINPTQVQYVPTVPGLSTSILPRTQDSEFAGILCEASDAAHGNSGISSISINGLRLPNDASTGTNTATCRVVTWLQPGVNTFEIVAADGFFQRSLTTNILSITRSSVASTNSPLIKIGKSNAAEDTLTIEIGGPLAGSAALEFSTDLINWNKIETSASVPVLSTGTDTAGPYGIYYGSSKLTIPKTSLDVIPKTFYRAKLN